MGRSRGCLCTRLKVSLTLASACVHLPQSAALLTQLECTAHHARLHRRGALHEETHPHTHAHRNAGAPPRSFNPESECLSTSPNVLLFLRLCHQVRFPPQSSPQSASTSAHISSDGEVGEMIWWWRGGGGWRHLPACLPAWRSLHSAAGLWWRAAVWRRGRCR